MYRKWSSAALEKLDTNTKQKRCILAWETGEYYSYQSSSSASADSTSSESTSSTSTIIHSGSGSEKLAHPSGPRVTSASVSRHESSLAVREGASISIPIQTSSWQRSPQTGCQLSSASCSPTGRAACQNALHRNYCSN